MDSCNLRQKHPITPSRLACGESTFNHWRSRRRIYPQQVGEQAGLRITAPPADVFIEKADNLWFNRRSCVASYKRSNHLIMAAVNYQVVSEELIDLWQLFFWKHAHNVRSEAWLWP
jgi:hypothetical protein